jgi:predicted hydrocarbon binding protein
VSDKNDKSDRADKDGGPQINLADALKKVVTAGLGAAFMTEESIRAYVSELKLPKDVLNVLLNQASKGKEEIVNRAGNEIAKIFSKIDFVKEISRFAEEHKFKISAEIEVLKKDEVGTSNSNHNDIKVKINPK